MFFQSPVYILDLLAQVRPFVASVFNVVWGT